VFTKIISGGQTGVDRAALDVAMQLALPCGGWCPKGRRAEDGAIPDKYPLTETPSSFYPARTRYNVRDSDGTLVLTRGLPKGGTALTIELATRQGKPHFEIDLDQEPSTQTVLDWAQRNNVRILNVAGPRESESRGIYSKAADFLRELLS
jgi:predicted Rossmann fold nucleotide-binding protein DprA/Smf involved in DNA uptake